MDSQDSHLQEQTQGDDAAGIRQRERDYRASEEFRAACEARFVLAKPLHQRREYLSGVEQHRGKPAREYLENVIRAEWEKKKPPTRKA